MRLIILSLAILVAACDAQSAKAPDDGDASAPMGKDARPTPMPDAGPEALPSRPDATTPQADASMPEAPLSTPDASAPEAPLLSSCAWETAPITCGYNNARSEFVAMRKDGRMCATCLKDQNSHEQVTGCWTSGSATQCDPIHLPTACSFLCVMRCDECVYAGQKGDSCSVGTECVSGICASNYRCT